MSARYILDSDDDDEDDSESRISDNRKEVTDKDNTVAANENPPLLDSTYEGPPVYEGPPRDIDAVTALPPRLLLPLPPPRVSSAVPPSGATTHPANICQLLVATEVPAVFTLCPPPLYRGSPEPPLPRFVVWGLCLS